MYNPGPMSICLRMPPPLLPSPRPSLTVIPRACVERVTREDAWGHEHLLEDAVGRRHVGQVIVDPPLHIRDQRVAHKQRLLMHIT
jgi:hypothetical protein